MTEAEWLACTDPQKMLEFLREKREYLWGRVTERKLRLFSVACCRRIWHLFTDQRSQWAIEVVEQFVAGKATKAEMRQAVEAAWAVSPSRMARAAQETASCSWQSALAITQAMSEAWQTARAAARAVKVHGDEQDWANERQVQAALVRDLFGPLPLRRSSLPVALPTWNDDVVVRLAQAAYEQRNMPKGTLPKDLLAMLADALEQAGCTDVDILGHLRGPGPHVRGCWVVDLCLGKS